MKSVRMRAPWGSVGITWEGGRLLLISLSSDTVLRAGEESKVPPEEEMPAAAHAWLKGFIRGTEHRPFPLLECLLDDAGMEGMRRRVMNEVANIAFGETRTYSEIAFESGTPGAARAVGRILASNPFPLLVPCHRVILSSGKQGGFREGSELKARLLSWEKEMIELTHGTDHNHRTLRGW